MAKRLHEMDLFNPHIRDVRGRGMLWALEFRDAGFANGVVKRALRSGLLLLQSGAGGDSITIAPPPVMTDEQLQRAFDLLAEAVRDPVLA
jgi:diaminobutyrate-2-oxoglutarate transaminase